MIDLLSPETVLNPYPTYNKMREESPVCEISPGGIYVISLYEDVQKYLQDYELFTAIRKTELFSPSWLSKKCQSDLYLTPFEPPEYRHRRSAINAPFVSSSINELKSLMESTAETLTKKITHKNDIEFLLEFAYPYVGRIMGEITGLQHLQTAEETQEWIRAVELATIPKPDKKTREYIEKTILKRKALFERVLLDRQINHRNDIVSELATAKINGVKLTDDEVINAIELLIRSGFQITVHLLANSIIQLIRRPELLSELIQSPGLIPAFVDELLRLHSSLPLVIRHATEEVTLHDITIPKGGQVFFSLAAANRDPRVFPNPNEYDLTRDSKKEHMAFGYGPHICLGLHLARLELEVALKHLLPLIPRMSCPKDDQLQWMNTLLFRGLESLPLQLKPQN